MTEQQEEVLPVAYGGREWQLPELGAKQLRKVRAKIIALTDFLDGVGAETKDKDGKELTAGYRFVHMSDELYSDMLDVVYWGLTRAEPDLVRETFDELKPVDSQLFSAFLKVRRQSGLFVLVPKTEGTPQGEAPAAIGE
jgi:hypothetical protein